MCSSSSALLCLHCFALLSSAEQAVYNRPRVADRSRPREGRDVLEAYQLAQRLQSMVGSFPRCMSSL